jgi:hypothetical protein
MSRQRFRADGVVCRAGALGNHGGQQLHEVGQLLGLARVATFSARPTRLQEGGLTFRLGGGLRSWCGGCGLQVVGSVQLGLWVAESCGVVAQV